MISDFPNIFCINLDRRPDRWKKTQSELSKHGFRPVERISAIDGHAQSNIPEGLSPGQYGILRTHLLLVKMAVLKNYENIVVLEDDIELHKDFNKIFNVAIKDVPSKWGFIYCGANHQGSIFAIKENSRIYQISNSYGLHFVIINKCMFQRIIHILETKVAPVDVLYAHLQKQYPSFCIYPGIAYQRPDFSDIEMKKVDHVCFRQGL